jgi:hypothetical protein
MVKMLSEKVFTERAFPLMYTLLRRPKEIKQAYKRLNTEESTKGCLNIIPFILLYLLLWLISISILALIIYIDMAFVVGHHASLLVNCPE